MYHSILDSGVSSKLFINDLVGFLNQYMLLKVNKNNKRQYISKELKEKMLNKLNFEIKDILLIILKKIVYLLLNTQMFAGYL